MEKTQLKQINGMMWVSDVPKSLKYYTKKLGFSQGYTCETDGVMDFAIVERDGIELHLQVCACEDGRHTGNTFLEIQVNNIDSISNEYTAADVNFVKCLTEEDWGKSFKIADPDGNWILFTEYDC